MQNINIRNLYLQDQYENLARKCQLNVMVILGLVCTEANVERDGIAIFVNVRVPVSPELLVEMVRNKYSIPLMRLIYTNLTIANLCNFC